MEKDISVIPVGQYCYTFIGAISKAGGYRIKSCPYWSINSNYGDQNNGYCSYLEVGDWEEGGFLLWDQVKLCDINEE